MPTSSSLDIDTWDRKEYFTMYHVRRHPQDLVHPRGEDDSDIRG